MLPLNEQAYQHLQKLILSNLLSYGQIYSETRLSRELGISRTPFRDAVHRLAQEGYIDIIPSKGFTLHQINVDDVNETLQIRSALESYCTLQIARESDTSRAQALFAELNELLYKMETVASTSHSIETFCQYDFQFHTSIINALNNKQFTSLFAALMYRMRKLAELSLRHEDRMTDTCAEHRAILNAMQSGDTAHIYEITIFHMEQPKTISLEDL